MLLDPFAARFDVLAHDQRGWAARRSRPARTRWPTTPPTPLALLDHVGWDRCPVVGISFGGMVAQELAVTAPGAGRPPRARCAPRPAEPAAPRTRCTSSPTCPPDERAAVGARLLDTRFTPEWLADAPADRSSPSSWRPRGAGEQTDEQRRGEAEQLEARRDHDVWDRLRRITCPTLVAARPLRRHRPAGQQRGHRRRGSPAPSSASTRAATPSSSRTRRPARHRRLPDRDTDARTLDGMALDRRAAQHRHLEDPQRAGPGRVPRRRRAQRHDHQLDHPAVDGAGARSASASTTAR